MSRLEVQAQPVLRVLVTGEKTPKDLKLFERAIVARWATKTAATLNLASDFCRLFDQSFLAALYKEPLQLPDGVFVVAGQHSPTGDSYWLQGQGVEFFAPRELMPLPEDRERLGAQGFRVGLLLNMLCLAVVYWPFSQWRLGLWGGVQEPLWPTDWEPVFVQHIYDGESEPQRVSSRLFLYRMLENIGAVSAASGTMRLAMRKNRVPHISGPEPGGAGNYLPVPNVITPEIDRAIREWLGSRPTNRS